MDKNIEKKLSIGNPNDIGKEFAPALEIQNHVLWVNENFPELPFKLKKGEPTNMGLFLSPFQNEFTKELEVRKDHNRSATIGRVIFKDIDGNIYRDVDIKGMGFIRESQFAGEYFFEVHNPVQKNNEEGESYGILNRESAIHDRNFVERFVKAGIRTCRIIAIVGLEEIVIKDEQEKIKKISVEEAKRRKIIHKDAEPVIAIRAFGTKTRIGEDFSREDIEDARLLVAQEIGENYDQFGTLEYIKWLVGEIGKNVGLAHKNKWLHGFLGRGHNVTLDGRIVDLDSVREPVENSEVFKDYSEASQAVQHFIARVSTFFWEELRELDKQREIFSIFGETYQKASGKKW